MAKQTLFASLANKAATKEFIGPKAMNDFHDFLQIDDPTPKKISKPCVSPRTAVSVIKTLKVPRIRSISKSFSSDDSVAALCLITELLVRHQDYLHTFDTAITLASDLSFGQASTHLLVLEIG